MRKIFNFCFVPTRLWDSEKSMASFQHKHLMPSHRQVFLINCVNLASNTIILNILNYTKKSLFACFRGVVLWWEEVQHPDERDQMCQSPVRIFLLFILLNFGWKGGEGSQERLFCWSRDNRDPRQFVPPHINLEASSYRMIDPRLNLQSPCTSSTWRFWR